MTVCASVCICNTGIKFSNVKDDSGKLMDPHDQFKTRNGEVKIRALVSEKPGAPKHICLGRCGLDVEETRVDV